jgi:hypothetical protein
MAGERAAPPHKSPRRPGHLRWLGRSAFPTVEEMSEQFDA